ncbi:MAG: DUF3465 domain-containing protein [Thiothrix sp.]|uniref:DUF3465 domain-containing protein n=1 Tax=Thiothrix sp. TaxID=1032 RepID=UPI002615EF00|nr:DUF3465 domain-containing protein [Thiothrix sp.]MDD5393808.1 DUF3465 domain-containing protein [Thiothrix sp.]
MQKNVTKTVVVLVGAGLLALYQHFQQPNNTQASTRPPTTVSTQTQGSKPSSADYQQVVEKIRNSRNNPDAKFRAIVQGTVVKLLKDDREGSPHQRFLVEIAPDITLLVAHNIELAPRVPVQQGETITLNAEYVWNDKGGVLHWTHHDPQGRKSGWIEVAGKRYE